MPDSLFVNADWSALVPAGSEEAAFGITPNDAKRRGLLPLGKGETLGEPELLVSANLTEPTESSAGDAPEETVADEPKAKEAPTPADKSVKKPKTK